MGEKVLKNVRVYFGGYDISGQTNNMTLTKTAELKDRTTFKSSARQRIAGLQDVEVALSGNWNSTVIDKPISETIATTGQVLSIIASGTSQGSICYFVRSITGEYSPAGSIGELYGFDFAGYAQQQPLVRGKLIENSATLSTGNGTAVGLGVTPTSTQKLYVVHHVLGPSSSGSLSKAHIQTSSSSGFGTSSTKILLTSVTHASTVRGQWASTTPSTKPCFVRVVITSSSGTPRYNGVICAGIY